MRRKLKTTESDLRKTEGQLKDNLAALDQMAADKENLVKLLKASEQGLTEASAELSRLHSEVRLSRDAELQLRSELEHTRGALSVARTRSAELAAEQEATVEAAVEIAEITALAEHVETEALTERMAALESELALARATAERLAEKEVLVSAEMYLRRREYGDIVAGGEDVITGALAARDRAIADAQNQLDYMRRDLSMLTAAGAQIAAALEQRNSEYSLLLDRAAVAETARLTASIALPAPADAGANVAALPDLQADLDARTAELDELKSEHENLKTALEAAIAARETLQQQLDERINEIVGLNGAVATAQEQLAALAADKESLVQRLAERSSMVSGLLDKIGAYDGQLRSLLATVAQAAKNGGAGESEAEAAAAGDEAQPVAQQEEGETHVS